MSTEDVYKNLFGAPTTTLSDLLGYHAPRTATPLANNSSRGLLSNLLPPPSSASGIHFQGRRFSEPTPLGFVTVPKQPGVYAILVSDNNWKPRPYRVLYFGKAVDLSARVCSSHEKHGEWGRCAAGGTLYVAWHAIPGSTEFQRATLEENLIKHFSP